MLLLRLGLFFLCLRSCLHLWDVGKGRQNLAPNTALTVRSLCQREEFSVDVSDLDRPMLQLNMECLASHTFGMALY